MIETLANVVLAVHAAIVVFVVGGLVSILVGNGLHWRWVDALWFRLAHLAAILVVVTESWFGIVCPLTTLEMFLRSKVAVPTYAGGFIEHWLQRALYFDAPQWVFTLIYSVFGAMVAATWWFFPPRRTVKLSPQAIVSTVPPSTRNAAPVVADACNEHT